MVTPPPREAEKRTRHGRLYAFSLVASVAGYVWLWLNVQATQVGASMVTVCALKGLTGWPCPACGTTRALLTLARGDLAAAVTLNPLCLIAAAGLLVVPVWTALDLGSGRRSLPAAFERAEGFLRRPRAALPLGALVLANWGWNLVKGL
jgi:hypothetical protein